MSKTTTLAKDDRGIEEAARNAGGAAVDAGPKIEGGALTQTGSRALASYDFGEDAGVGLENVDKSELKLPWITLLQSNSPQVEDGDPKQMPGAKAGQFLNTLTKRLYDGKKGFVIVPAMRDRNFVEYTPRNLGGGFLGAHSPTDPAITTLIANHNRKLGRRPDAEIYGKLSTTTKHSSDGLPLDGTEFIDTRYLFAVVAPEDEPAFWAMLSFKSTQIDKQKQLVSRALGFKYPHPAKPGVMQNPPLWAHRWYMTSKPEQKKGKTFQGYELKLAEKNEDGSEKPEWFSLMKMDDELYQLGRSLYKAMASGEAKADFSQQASEADGGAAAADEEDVPM